MKYIKYTLILVLCLGMIGCQKEPSVTHVESITISASSVTIVEGETYTLTATVSPSNADNKLILWTTSDASVATVKDGTVTAVAKGSASITAKSDDGDKTATCEVRVTSPVPSGAVDLGLSVFWSTSNLGATKPEEYGGYYQWAGTTDVTDTSIYLDLSNCPYHAGSDDKTGWTKYITSSWSSYWSGSGSPDNKTVLDQEDDVAHVKLGGKWRMPTREEWQELRDNCSWTWTTLNGKNGYKAQSKKTGFTDKWIFLPAAGFRILNYLYYADSDGQYWSSSPDTDIPGNAYGLYFYSDYVSTGRNNRFNGRSVRPVSD